MGLIRTLDGCGGAPVTPAPPAPVERSGRVGETLDAARVEALHAEHAAFLGRVIRRLAGDGPHVDDVLQETFLVAYRKPGAFSQGHDPRAFLYGVAVRRTLRHLRGGRRFGLFRRRLRIEPAAPPAEAPDVTVESRERVEALHRAIAALPFKQREVVVLHELEGLEGAEVASMLGVPVNTVWRRLHDARNTLRARMTAGTEVGSGVALVLALPWLRRLLPLAGGGGSSAGGAASAIAVAAVVASSAAGVVAVQRFSRTTAPPSPAIATAAPAPVPELPVPLAVVADPAPEPPPVLAVAPSRARWRTVPDATPLSPGGSLDAELDLYEAAHAASGRGDLVGALAAIDELLRRYPTTALAPEARLSRVGWLAAAGRTREAIEAAERLADDPALASRRDELLDFARSLRSPR